LKNIVVLFLFLTVQLQAQDNKFGNLLVNADTLNKARLKTVVALQGGIWVGSLVALNQAWYANYPKAPFHLFNDAGEWQQVDKVGHAFSAYYAANLSSKFFMWSGVNRKKSALLGAGMGIAYESVIEILDGYSAQWGFSLADMAANISGSLLFAGQEYAWGEQRIRFKFTSHRVKYDDPELKQKADDLYGTSLPERILKDYNGQTYWWSINMWSFAKQSRLPPWLNVAVGYGAEGMFGGYDNDWIDKNNIYHDRRDIPRVRQFFISPDIDFSKMRYRGRYLKIFQVLNFVRFKVPLPTLEINSLGRLKMHGIYF
jgi:hypothetical protein